MGILPIRIYGYNNEHDVIVYTVVKDTQNQGRHALIIFEGARVGGGVM